MFLLHWEFLLVLSACLRQGLARQPRLASTHWLACCLWFPSAGITTTHYHTWLSPKVLYTLHLGFWFILNQPLKRKICFIFNYGNVWASVCGYVHMSAVPPEARRECWMPWSYTTSSSTDFCFSCLYLWVSRLQMLAIILSLCSELNSGFHAC